MATVDKLRHRPQHRPLHRPERTRKTWRSSAALSTSVSFPFPCFRSIIRVSVFLEAWNCSSPFFFIAYMMTSDLLLSYTVVVTIPFSILRSSASCRKTHLDLLNLVKHLQFKSEYIWFTNALQIWNYHAKLWNLFFLHLGILDLYLLYQSRWFNLIEKWWSGRYH